MTLIKETSRLTPTELASKADFIVEQMTDNTDFLTPFPSLAVISTAADDLREAIVAALDGGPTATAVRKARQRELKDKLDQLAHYVANTAGNDELKIRSCGFGYRRTPSPQAEPGKPTNLSARISEYEGRVNLAWTPVEEALTYHIMHHPSDPLAVEGWTLVGVSTRAAYSVKGLPSGKVAHFKVAGIGTRGMGPWSQVASSLVK